MIRYSKIFLYATVVILLLWLVPWTYSFIVSKPYKTPFTLYSGVIHDFVMLDNSGANLERKDLKGNLYTESQFDSILPMFYYRQLIADEKFPKEMNGIVLTPRIPQTENFMFRHTPSNVNAPKIALYPLLESMSGRVDLKMPGDVFRITPKGIEFITIEKNQVDDEKSKRYTDALQKKGFIFPARIIAGNPTTRKDYDEGYLVTDHIGQLFHLKQVSGRPFVRKVDLPEGMHIRYIFPTEFKNRRFHAFITDDKQNLYTLQAKTYELRKLPVPSFNPEEEGLSVIGNIFDWTLLVSSEKGETLYAVDASDYSLLKEMVQPIPEESLGEKIGGYIFPVSIRFTSSLDKFVKMRFE